MTSITDAQDAFAEAASVLHSVEISGSAQERLDALRFQRMVRRRSEYQSLVLIAGLERDGEFAARGVQPAEAVADLERCRPAEARRRVAVAGSLFPVALDGRPLEPRLPATAAALGAFDIDLAHAEVIEEAMGSPRAGRLDAGRWSGAEEQLAEWARTYRPDQLRQMASRLLDSLDQDGPEPGEDKPQLNELALTRSADGIGGRIKGRLDSSTFDAVTRAIKGFAVSYSDERKSLEERQADALGELCEHILNDAVLPTEGGERPHITVIMSYDWMLGQYRETALEFGGRIGAGELRRLLCDAKIVPAVFGGESQPLDFGRERRTVSTAQRRAVAARDRGCAFPGCCRTPRRCEVHHVVEWHLGGKTNVDDCVMLCPTHHRMIHNSGWQILMPGGIPEFIPPKWLDPSQKARRQPVHTAV